MKLFQDPWDKCVSLSAVLDGRFSEKEWLPANRSKGRCQFLERPCLAVKRSSSACDQAWERRAGQCGHLRAEAGGVGALGGGARPALGQGLTVGPGIPQREALRSLSLSSWVAHSGETAASPQGSNEIYPGLVNIPRCIQPGVRPLNWAVWLLENHPQTWKGPREALLSWRRITSPVRNRKKVGQFPCPFQGGANLQTKRPWGNRWWQVPQACQEDAPTHLSSSFAYQELPRHSGSGRLPSWSNFEQVLQDPQPWRQGWGAGWLYRGRELLAGFMVAPAVIAWLPWASMDSLKTAFNASNFLCGVQSSSLRSAFCLS